MDYRDDMPFTEIQPKWADQTCVYGWLDGFKFGEPFPALIDVITCQNKQVKYISQYRGWITKEHQETLARRLAKLWADLIDGTFINRLANKNDLDLVWIASKGEKWF